MPTWMVTTTTPRTSSGELGVHVYLAYHKQIPIGFGLVGSAEAFISDADVKDLDEFFVVRRYRRSGVGQ